jgi:hypothetical protein
MQFQTSRISRHVGFVLLAGAASAPVLADTATVRATEINPAVVEIRSDGKQYTTMKNTDAAFAGKADVYVSAITHTNTSGAAVHSWEDKGHVKSYSVWLGMHVEGQPIQTARNFTEAKVAQTNLARSVKTVDFPAYIKLDRSLVEPYLVARCNEFVTAGRKVGVPDAEIFGTDREVQIAVLATLHYNTAGKQGGEGYVVQNGGSYPRIKVVCKAYSPPQAPGTTGGATPKGTGPALLTHASVAVQSPGAPIQCPADLTATMTFRASTPGHFSYRVLSASGKASPAEMISLKDSDKQGSEYVRVVQHKFAVGLPAERGVAGGMQAGGGGLASATNGTGESIGGGRHPGAGAPGGFTAAPVAQGVHQDSLWIEITGGKAGSVQRSDYGRYKAECLPPAAPTVNPTGLGGGAPAGLKGSTLPVPPTTHPSSGAHTRQGSQQEGVPTPPAPPSGEALPKGPGVPAHSGPGSMSGPRPSPTHQLPGPGRAGLPAATASGMRR